MSDRRPRLEKLTGAGPSADLNPKRKNTESEKRAFTKPNSARTYRSKQENFTVSGNKAAPTPTAIGRRGKTAKSLKKTHARNVSASEMMLSHVVHVVSLYGVTTVVARDLAIPVWRERGKTKKNYLEHAKKKRKINGEARPTTNWGLCKSLLEGPVGTPVPGFHRSSTPLFIEYDTVTDTHLQTATVQNRYFWCRIVLSK